MKTYYHLLALVLVTFLASHAKAESGNPEETIAMVGAVAITRQDLLDYARPPIMRPYLNIPGGPMRILDNMIKERLLVLEGERLGMPKLDSAEGGDSAYAISVRLRKAPRCAPPDETTAKAFYDGHPGKFSTPLYLRLNRYGLRFSPQNESTISEKLLALKRDITAGVTNFTALSDLSEDEIGRTRHGDIGYLPYDDPTNPIMSTLSLAQIGQVIGPLKQKDMLFLYQVTARREPVLTPYDSIKNEVSAAQQEECYSQKLDALFTELKQRWPVKILTEDITPNPVVK